MPHPGRFKIASRNRDFDGYADPALREARRLQRIVDSLREEIRDEATVVRARQIFSTPRELFRLEIENTAMGYHRTTVLDRNALETLQEDAEVGTRLQVD